VKPLEVAQSRVIRRVHAEERHRLAGPSDLLDSDALLVGEARRVAEAGQHVVVARQGVEAALRVVIDRRLLPQPPVGRIRILVDLPVVGVVEAGVVLDHGGVSGLAAQG
jgi:hypothetical protein